MSDRPDPRPRGYYRHFAPQATRWNDNDPYGHVNNSVHYFWFDSAVNGWMIERGMLDIAGETIGLVVETGCRYFAPLAYPQKVEIGLRIARLGGSSLTWHLGVFAEGAATPAAEGHFTHVIVDAGTRRPKSMPDDWRSAYETLAG
ncbi:thioesterase family protein [Sphingomicrobium sp. XHP0239]|uniref:acyl-CoA thioesterase n=1 Tax=Sphingomicrobium maritimum TaxID=3133972 RepID=UPI0031CC5B36